MDTITYSPAAIARLLNAVRHPETVDGWEDPRKCPECNGNGYSWSEFALRDEECDECSGTGIKTPPVSDEMDARNSKPFPY